MTEEFMRLMQEANAEMVEHFKEVFGVEGIWYYRDLPQMLPEYFTEIVNAIGEENIRWITMASYSTGLRRGQMIYSEQGRLNIQAYQQNRCS